MIYKDRGRERERERVIAIEKFAEGESEEEQKGNIYNLEQSSKETFYKSLLISSVAKLFMNFFRTNSQGIR